MQLAQKLVEFDCNTQRVVEGGPSALIQALNLPFAEAFKAEVVVLNGNRALYEHGWRLPRDVVKLYVQHSSVDDAQAGWLRPLLRRVLLKVLLARMDAVIRVSESCLPDHFAPGKVWTVPNGVDLQQFPMRSNWREVGDANPWRLLMVGALTPNKNQRLAIALLADWPHAELTLVGEGKEEAALRAFADQLGVSARVHWMGQQADTGPFYREADVCLLLSHHEAAPFGLLEAMASGTPVLAACVGGVPEVLVDGQTGALLPERTDSALVAVARMGRLAQARVAEGFTADHMAQGFLDVVSHVRGSRRCT